MRNKHEFIRQVENNLLDSPRGTEPWFYWRGMLYALKGEWANNPPQYAEALLKLELDSEFSRDLRIERAWETTQPSDNCEWDTP